MVQVFIFIRGYETAFTVLHRTTGVQICFGVTSTDGAVHFYHRLNNRHSVPVAKGTAMRESNSQSHSSEPTQ